MAVSLSHLAVFFLLVAVAPFAANSQQVDADCPNEAQSLEDCAARNAATDIQLLASCLSCVTDSLPADAASSDCQSFSDEFCTNLDNQCDPECDEGPCATEFTNFFHCLAGRQPKASS